MPCHSQQLHIRRTVYHREQLLHASSDCHPVNVDDKLMSARIHQTRLSFNTHRYKRSFAAISRAGEHRARRVMQSGHVFQQTRALPKLLSAHITAEAVRVRNLGVLPQSQVSIKGQAASSKPADVDLASTCAQQGPFTSVHAATKAETVPMIMPPRDPRYTHQSDTQYCPSAYRD